MIKRLMVTGFVALLVLFSFTVDSQAATIRISAPKVEVEVAPGETYTGEITAENPTEESIKVRVYLEDWVYAPGGTGEKIFSPIASTPFSAGKWITFSPAEETIGPFGKTVVRYTIAVPSDAKGGHYAVLFFETILGTAQDEEGVTVLVAGRIGSLFSVETKGFSEKNGQIKLVEIKPSEGNQPLQISSTFFNSGNVDVTLGGNFLIMDKDGRVRARGDLNKIYTFPGQTETGKTEWVGRLAPGDYQAILTYDLGKGKTIVEEKSLTAL